jgi:eukaryotic-like serine/threonine-protein kinase
MGIVYRAFDPQIKRSVAIKVIRPHLLNTDRDDFLTRFRIEAQTAESLSHPGIVAVYEYGEEAGYAYIAMEYVEGRSLRECFEQKIRFSLEQSVDILSQLLKALQYAHERGVWHRDIKPANLLMGSDGQVKITDFGIARPESSILTRAGAIMGTPGFIAPEMYLSDEFDHRVDLFAAGVVLYQLLTGVPPFGGTAEKIMLKVCYETPLPPSVAGRLPAARPFDAVLLQALARRPQDRFASADQFLHALLQAQAPGGPAAAEATVIQSRPPARSAPREPLTPSASATRPTEEPVKPRANTVAPAGAWNLDQLAQIEQRLARFVGPIARVLVRRGTATTSDPGALTDWLAGKLASSGEREAFLKSVGAVAPSANPEVGPPGRADPVHRRQSTASASASRPVTPDDIARASQLLVAHLGPIAPVLAKRAAKSGTSREEFIAALVPHLTERERSRFLRAFG